MGREQLLLAFKQGHRSPCGILFAACRILRFAVVACRESDDSATNIEAPYCLVWSIGPVLHLYVEQYCTPAAAIPLVLHAANVVLEVILPSFLLPSRPRGVSD